MDAARGQLESAILLWFLEKDLASIHTLTVAAQELLHHTGKPQGKPSKLVSLIKSQPRAFQKQAREAQNFFKHPQKHTRVLYSPLSAELFIIDALALYEDLANHLTPLMKLFAIRFSLSYPDTLPFDLTVKLPIGVRRDDLAKLGRADFLKEVLPFLA
ncbi:MAG: hypothetical protein DME75_11245 [Verrucomicrobia bacterium]|nr:MAG: hypothetical protein DME75_11245 [Verrucomicrobiota bacterium]